MPPAQRDNESRLRAGFNWLVVGPFELRLSVATLGALKPQVAYLDLIGFPVCMNVSDDLLDRFIRNRTLVCFRREALDARSIQGVPLMVSDELLLLQYVCDFRLDGLLLLRRQDISAVARRETDAFQQQLLERDGVWEQIRVQPQYKIGTLPHFFSSLKVDSFVIVENELPGQNRFWIGRLDGVQAEHLHLHEFSGAGIWCSDVSEIRYDEITCCQFGSNYINFYSDYFYNQRIATEGFE